jgi:hypothetical protein
LLDDKLNPMSDYEQRTIVEPLVERHGANKWWRRDLNSKCKWEVLEHNGVLFPPEYIPHGLPIQYEGKYKHKQTIYEQNKQIQQIKYMCNSLKYIP